MQYPHAYQHSAANPRSTLFHLPDMSFSHPDHGEESDGSLPAHGIIPEHKIQVPVIYPGLQP